MDDFRSRIIDTQYDQFVELIKGVIDGLDELGDWFFDMPLMQREALETKVFSYRIGDFLNAFQEKYVKESEVK